MTYSVDPNAKNVWIRDNADTMDLSVQTEANAVYLENGRTLEQEVGKGTMVSNVVTVDGSMEKVVEGTYDGVYESCKMYGRSLVNILTGEVESNLSQKYIDFPIVGVKANTTYMAIFNLETNAEFPKCGILLNKNTWNATSKPCNNKYNKILLTTTSDETVGLRIWYDDGATDRILEPTNVMLIEYQEGMENWDIPYFEGICDVKMPILKNIGKNLAKVHINKTSESIEDGYVKVIENGTVTQDIDYTDSTELIPIKPNTYYTCSWQLVSGSISTEKPVNACFAFCDKNKEVVKWTDGANKLSPENAYYIKRVRLHWGNSEATLKDFKFTMMLEESKTVTEFEPYKTSILTTPEEVILRKVGDVCDSYDALTGEYVQRIAEQTINGSENWGKMDEDTAIQNDTCLFTCYGALSNVPRDTKYLSDKYNIITGYQELLNTDKEMVHLYLDRALYFRISKSKLATVNIEGFKQWLAQNPFTIQYQLETPTTTIIEPSTIPFVYENGHVILESGYEGQSLLPTLEYSTVINRTGQIQSIANTVQKQEKQITTLEQMLIQNIVNLDYNNTLLTLNLEINEVI